MDLRSMLLVDPATKDLPALIEQVNRILIQLQNGNLVLDGIRFDTRREAAPTAEPGIGESNLRLARVAGVIGTYQWDGSAWVPL